MNPAARTVFYFGLYLYLVGLTLITVPNVLMNMLQMPETNEVWIRVVGVLVICIAFYYHMTALANVMAFFKYTIPTRFFVFISFTALALLDYVSPMIIGFGVIDLLGAIWTWISLPPKGLASTSASS
ncbi:MAG: hypothetical protein JNK14_17925 [Chitinophagaceae bacterium]|nr:hypothetical protein [Chitinophagaceae bacterium]